MNNFQLLITAFVLFCSDLDATDVSNFVAQPELAGKTCPEYMLRFTTDAKNVLECMTFCSLDSVCNGGCYSQSTRTCYVCLFLTIEALVMTNIGGTVCYTHNLCSVPPFSSNVVYEQIIAIAPIGFQLSYSCTPCTYFIPQGNPSFITCQDDRTWTIPVCMNAASAGVLKTGSPIPTNPVGCVSRFGSQCPTTDVSNVNAQGVWYLETINQNSNCFCDAACCSAEDCCYDYGC